MFEFNTEVKISVHGGHNVVGGGGLAKLKWVATMEAREHGINCFGIFVPEQTVLVTLTKYDSEKDEEYNEDMTFLVKDVEIDDYVEGGKVSHFQLIPNELQIYNGRFKLIF